MRIGIIGAGQLGRMLALAGYPLGLRLPVPGPERGFARRAGRADRHRRVRRSRMSRAASRRAVDVVTYEFENVPVAALAQIAAVAHRVLPPVEALRVVAGPAAREAAVRAARHSDAAVRRGRFAAPSSQRAVATIGLPGVLKTRRLGYDGKGQRYLRTRRRRWRRVGGARRRAADLEGFVRLRPRGVDHRRAQHARRDARSIRSPRTCTATASCA